MILIQALLAGGAAVLAYAPFDFWPLMLLALAWLFRVALTSTPRIAAQAGFFFGLGLFAGGVHWVFVSCYRFGNMGVLLSSLTTLLLVAYLALYPAVFAWLAARFVRLDQCPAHSTGRPVRGIAVSLMVLPALWVGLEWIRGVLFTGFPWLSVGYTQVDGPLAGVAPLAGVFGISWLLAFAAALLAMIAVKGRQSALPAGVGVAALVVLVVVFPAGKLWTQPVGAPLSVALIQGNVPQLTRWNPDKVRDHIAGHLRLSEPFWGVDLLIWPENAIPAFAQMLPDELLPALARKGMETGSDLLTGMPLGDPVDGPYFNGIRLAGGDEYRKQHLVPFGEYVPLVGLLGDALDLLRVPMSAFSPGDDDQPPLRLLRSDVMVAPTICYEILFGDEVAQMFPQAQVLVNISNDAWFGDTIAPHQHLQIARMRVLESGRPLLRATNSGITAIVNAGGVTQAVSPQFVETVLTGIVQPHAGATPYIQNGDWPLLVLLVGTLGYALFLCYRGPKAIIEPL